MPSGFQYYAYVYAQSIAMDFLHAFKSAPDGLLDRDMSRRYRRTILEVGSTKTAIEMCTDFLGRPPNADAFYKWVSSPLDLSALDQEASK
jgi:Zn-dependent oligopeptidase